MEQTYFRTLFVRMLFIVGTLVIFTVWCTLEHAQAHYNNRYLYAYVLSGVLTASHMFLLYTIIAGILFRVNMIVVFAKATYSGMLGKVYLRKLFRSMCICPSILAGTCALNIFIGYRLLSKENVYLAEIVQNFSALLAIGIVFVGAFYLLSLIRNIALQCK